MDDLLNIRALVRNYGDLRVLAGVDLRLERGEVLGLLGPNGAGKTTCLQILSGNLAPSAGDVRVMGVDLVGSALRAKRLIGYLPERPPLYPEMRVDEYLDYCACLHRVPRQGRAKAAERVKELCGLEDKGRRLLGTLSKGYRQRVGIAQAILHEPDLLILDEPTEGLDPVQLREVRELIRTLASDCGIILSSHVLPEVQAVCTKVAILRAGRVIHIARLEQGADELPLGRYRIRLAAPPPVEVLTALPEVVAVHTLKPQGFRITLRPGENPAALSRRLVEAGWGLTAMTPDHTDLESVYFDILGGEQAA